LAWPGFKNKLIGTFGFTLSQFACAQLGGVVIPFIRQGV